MKSKDLTNCQFGRLKVLELDSVRNRKKYWKCICTCGNVKIVSQSNLVTGNTKSCGCLNSELRKKAWSNKETARFGKSNPTYKHGACSDERSQTQKRLYTIWSSMKQRCNNSNATEYSIYGDRGIKVCDEWEHDFLNFYNWSIKHGYNENLTIDRIDVNKGYNPDNCRWVTWDIQSTNRNFNRNKPMQYIYNDIVKNISKIT